MSTRRVRNTGRRNDRSNRLVPVKSRTALKRRQVRTEEDINRIKKMYINFKKVPKGDISSINYNLYSWEDILAKTTTKITTATPGGTNSLNSIQMGTDIPSGTCATCHLDVKTCPGHLGRIEFKYPIAHPSRDISNAIIHVFNSVCESCGNLLLDKHRIERIVSMLPADDYKRLSTIAKESEKANCRTPGCYRGTPIRRDFRDGVSTFSRKDKFRTLVSVQYIQRVFDSISVEDAALLQFKAPAHPRNLIMRGIVVIPPCARAPSIMDDGTMRNSDTTDLYKSIIEANESLQSPDNVDALAKAVNNLMYKGIENVHGQITGSFKYKIGDKSNGAIRSISQGKTIMNSGRSVIVGDPELKFGEVGVPRVLADRMRIKETVDESNIDRLTRYLRDRKIFTIQPFSGELEGYSLRVNNKMIDEYELQYGDVIERSLMEADPVNGQLADMIMTFRQPVLHKYSLMAGTVRLRDNYTFAIHMAETTARNADFDGDEINMHATTDVDTMKQLHHTLYSPRNIISSQNSMALLAVVYDGLLAIYLMMLDPDGPVSKFDFMRYLKRITNRTDLPTLAQRASELGIKDLYTYRMVFSSILPSGFSYSKNDVVITNGILTSGRVGKNHVGQSPYSIIQAIMLQYDDIRARDFITDVYFILVEFLSKRSYTVGIRDLMIPDSLKEFKEEQLNKLMLDVEQLNSSNQTEIEKKISEKKIIFKINAITEKLHKECRDVMGKSPNGLVGLIESGAKGKNAEFGGMAISVGQRYSQGERMKLQLDHGTRCLPYFKKGDNSPLARGYCKSSYFEGLTLPEYLMGQIGARDDIVTMVMGTPETGRLSHETVRVMENAKTYYDGTVTNPGGKIVQYVYGGDGFEPERMLRVSDTNTFINVDSIIDAINYKYTGKSDVIPGLPAPVELDEYDPKEYVNGPDLSPSNRSSMTSPPKRNDVIYPTIKGSFDDIGSSEEVKEWLIAYLGDEDLSTILQESIEELSEAGANTIEIYQELNTIFRDNVDVDIYEDQRILDFEMLSLEPTDILVHIGPTGDTILKEIGEVSKLQPQNVYKILISSLSGPSDRDINPTGESQGFVKKYTDELLPMESESTDVVSLLNPLMAYKDISKSLHEAHRILKMDGLLMLPKIQEIPELNDIYDGFINVIFNDYISPIEFTNRSLNRDEMKSILDGLGMVLVLEDEIYGIWQKMK